MNINNLTKIQSQTIPLFTKLIENEQSSRNLKKIKQNNITEDNTPETKTNIPIQIPTPSRESIIAISPTGSGKTLA